MDAVEFLKKERSMCERYKNMCKDCPVSSEKSGKNSRVMLYACITQSIIVPL